MSGIQDQDFSLALRRHALSVLFTSRQICQNMNRNLFSTKHQPREILGKKIRCGMFRSVGKKTNKPTPRTQKSSSVESDGDPSGGELKDDLVELTGESQGLKHTAQPISLP